MFLYTVMVKCEVFLLLPCKHFTCYPVVTLQIPDLHFLCLEKWNSIMMLFSTNSERTARVSLYIIKVSLITQIWTLPLVCPLNGKMDDKPVLRQIGSEQKQERQERAQQWWFVRTTESRRMQMFFIWISKHILQTQHHKLCYLMKNCKNVWVECIYYRTSCTPESLRSPVKQVLNKPS